MIDLTPIINAVIALAAALVSAFLIPWLRKRYSAEKLAELLSWVDIAVTAAEQLYEATQGPQKKAYVLTFLAGKGYGIDDKAVDNAIEAAVLRLHREIVA